MSIEIIVVGASAGGIEALRVLIGALPAVNASLNLKRARGNYIALEQCPDCYVLIL